MKNPTSLLLIGGAGLAPHAWDAVRSPLPHPSVVAPRPDGRHDASVAEHARVAVAATTTERFTIVAHSVGGVVAAEIVRLFPDRVDAVLGICSTVPGPGGSFASTLPRPQRWILPLAIRLAGTRPPEKAILRTLADRLDPGVAEEVVEDYVAESRRLFLDRVPAGDWRGRAGYVLTTHDREMSRAAQEASAGRLSATWRHELPCGHLPMLETPAATASAIGLFLAETS